MGPGRRSTRPAGSGPARPGGEPGAGAIEPPLLSFVDVTKRVRDGPREVVVLDRVSFDLRAGGCAGVYGRRRSGKSTLLRIAAAIESPDAGAVRFDGREVTRFSPGERARLLRASVALLAGEDWLPSPGETVLDHVATALGSVGFTLREARRAALATLDRLGVSAVGAAEPTASLALGDRARAALARALVREPRLLIVDEPAPMPSLGERERFCALIREHAHADGIALLMASEDITALQGLEVLMSISGGELCSTGAQSSATGGRSSSDGGQSPDRSAKVLTLPSRSAAAARRP
jgi:ABC-type lipoprotein export system ATPase subunit